MSIFLPTTLIAALMIAVELMAPGRKWEKVVGWVPRAVALTSIQVLVAWVASQTWDVWFDRIEIFELAHLSTFTGGLLGYLVITFIYYWWHRARHSVPFLWRHLHQIHHSPQRIEIITSFYKHPLEIIVNGLLSSFILYVLLGLNLSAVVLAVGITAVAELFYHWNIKTPYWLGFIIQRPESHCVHHQRERHRNNYSDLPIWDMLFGTFHNPRVFDSDCGFAQDREKQLLTMLKGQDIHRGDR